MCDSIIILSICTKGKRRTVFSAWFNCRKCYGYFFFLLIITQMQQEVYFLCGLCAEGEITLTTREEDGQTLEVATEVQSRLEDVWPLKEAIPCK